MSVAINTQQLNITTKNIYFEMSNVLHTLINMQFSTSHKLLRSLAHHINN